MSTPEFFTLTYSELLVQPDPTGLAADQAAVPDTDPNLCDTLWLSSTSSAGNADAALGTLGIGRVVDLQQPVTSASGLFVLLAVSQNEPDGYWELRVGTAGAGPFPFTAGDPAEATFENPAYTPGLPAGTSYATADELARILQLPNRTAAQQAAMERALASAAREIDAFLNLTDPMPDPPPSLVVTVNLERAVEHWKQEQSPFGIVTLGGDNAPAFVGRNSWRRHGQTLLPLKESNWGVG